VNGVRTALNSLPSSMSSHDSVVGFESDMEATVSALYDEYDRAAEAVHALVDESMSTQIIHADWHPGNMLFKRDQVVAVVDYDSCRAAHRMVDVANGMLHFSLISGGSPETWPDNADEDRIGAFCRGYQSVAALSEVERRCLPHLMIEAIIAESVLPIVQTGHFGRWAGFGFLKMVARKVSWLLGRSDSLVQLAGSCAV